MIELEFWPTLLCTLLAASHTLGFICFRLIVHRRYPELTEWKEQLFMYITWPFIVIIAYKNYKR